MILSHSAAILGSRDGGPNYDRNTLTSKAGFVGVSGLFRFKPSGLVERGLEVREVQPAAAGFYIRHEGNLTIRQISQMPALTLR